MGWGRTILLGDIGNRLDIEDTETDISRIKKRIVRSHQKDMTQDQQIDHLMAENAELKLYLASVIRLLVRKDVMSSEKLRAMVEVMDAEDGKSDAKYEGSIA